MAKLDPRKSVIPKAKITLDENCGRTDRDFTSRKNFTNHVKTHSDEVFKCPKCPHIWKEGPEIHFNTKKALLKHIFEYHKSEKDCQDCDKTYSTSSNLKKHELSHQIIETCSKCNKTFASKYKLKDHEKSMLI